MMSNSYESPFTNRYASKEMNELFSDNWKFKTWRTLWARLAVYESKYGVNISKEQIEEMFQHIDTVNIERANELEKKTNHDVMAHILAYAEDCPKAAPIIHLGATSCYVTDNTDLIRMRAAISILTRKAFAIIKKLSELSKEYADVKTLSYTHMQPAQPTTVGKRMIMWTQDLMMDVEQMVEASNKIMFLGCRGATGTAASMISLLGTKTGVVEMEKELAKSFDMKVYQISGQTYTRKIDFMVLQSLSCVAQSASKFSNDIRFLSSKGEIMEPFGENQVGSSAMPYKQNPMTCERICSLSRYVINQLNNAADTAASQWLERTLDDSANRRLTIAEMFLATDAILGLYIKVLAGLRVNKDVIEKNFKNEEPMFLTEGIMMYCVNKKGLNRQEVHEIIRQHTLKDDRKKLLYELFRDKRLKFESYNEFAAVIDSIPITGMATEQTLGCIGEKQQG